ncbi:uncharacterized protein Dwil_GK15450 [Drosophila willistoni]|uniref:LRRCT domain-containing protein n=2 Tax=Drosophila willistoni TaxID=7260 RepID=B4MV79_DROWI|nr:uncharacterized protein Dwil_GK15450 [Drosophila willistoni]
MMMMTTKCVIIYMFLVSYGHVEGGTAVDVDNDDVSDMSPPSCIIHATLYKTPAIDRNPQDFGLPMDIDCTGNNNSARNEQFFDQSAQRVSGKNHVNLDGRQTPTLGSTSYGLEYLDNCLEMESLVIEGFKGDATLRLECLGSASLDKLEDITLQNNEFATLYGQSFEKVENLKRLQLIQNSLKYIESLENCDNMEELSILDETKLILGDAEILENLISLRKLNIKRIGKVKSEFFSSFNQSTQLRELSLEDVIIEPSHLLLETNSTELINLKLINCNLTSFGLEQWETSHLTHVNLSGNYLKDFSLTYEEGSSALISLDLSRNNLSSLNKNWFSDMNHLQYLFLTRNHLHQLSLREIMKFYPLSLMHIDLSWNNLMDLKETDKVNLQPSRQLQILIDNNPWSCQWLLNFSHTQPQLFRLFQYAKFISQINVNGLSCRPEEPKTLNTSAIYVHRQPHAHPHSNVSTFTVIYGNPMDYHRSQRSGALIIVFMLPLGIALLFLLLYLYLHCERLFHLSYYLSSFSCFGMDKSSSRPRFIDQVDIVRYPMANGNGNGNCESELVPDGYETPVSGAASICNCSGQRQSNCSRIHHVTYETLPYQLYAEIKEPEEQNDDECEAREKNITPSSTAPIYDHLSFVQEDELTSSTKKKLEEIA